MSYSAPWNAPKRRVINTDVPGLSTPPVAHVVMDAPAPVAPKKETKAAETPKPVKPVVEAVEEPEVEE
jgi:hypothetical protein